MQARISIIKLLPVCAFVLALEIVVMLTPIRARLPQFIQDPGEIAAPPADFPSCPATCNFNAAPWTKDYVAQQYSTSGWELP